MKAMKRLTLLLLVLTISLSIILPAQAANSPSLSGVQIFPKDHIWNTRVDNLPVDAKSDIYVNDLVKDTAAYTGLNYYIRTAIPYNVVNSTIPHQYIIKFNYNGAYSDNVAYPIPDNPLFEQGLYDHHMEIIDKDEMVLYELGSVKQWPNGSWSASTGAVWNLKGYAFRKNNETPMWATNEAGLATFPGLVRYDEVSAGQINHAIAMNLPAMQNTWVWPARSAQINDPPNPSHPPAGQRFRLKASYDISGFPPQAKVILQALKTYGMMAETNNGAGNPVSIIGSPDTRWNSDDLKTLLRVNLSNFEAVDVSSIMIDKNSAQARQITSVSSSSSITVTAPNGGETWQRGTSQTVKWSYTGSPGSTVDIVLLKAGTEVGTIASSVSVGNGGAGSYTWPISSTGSIGSDYKISVHSTSQPTVTDTSNNYFTLTSVTATPSITITSPHGGETWQRGTSHTITWSYTGSTGSTVKIVLVKGGSEVGTISAGTSTGNAGAGSYTWPISPNGGTGSDYQVRVQSTSQPAVTDTSNNYFTITSAPTTPSITVTSPNSGETWKRGTSHTVTWIYTGSPGATVKIVLLKGNLEAGTISAGTSIGSSGIGSYTWPIYPSGTTGSDYKVSVQSMSQPTIKDISNNYFTLTL